MAKNYWLIKSEPTSYSIDDLAKDKKTDWTGIRNYQARNYMKAMKAGDEALFYHSSCAVPAVTGLAKIIALAVPDPTQFNSKDYHYDPKATKTKPIWCSVAVSFAKKFKKPLSLVEIKAVPALETMLLAQKGSRLSIMPVSKQHFDEIVKRGMSK
jgi:predicted RNA-binding protein with PUA-like domain